MLYLASIKIKLKRGEHPKKHSQDVRVFAFARTRLFKKRDKGSAIKYSERTNRSRAQSGPYIFILQFSNVLRMNLHLVGTLEQAKHGEGRNNGSREVPVTVILIRLPFSVSSVEKKVFFSKCLSLVSVFYFFPNYPFVINN